jgi:hypothetical protein
MNALLIASQAQVDLERFDPLALQSTTRDLCHLGLEAIHEAVSLPMTCWGMFGPSRLHQK